METISARRDKPANGREIERAKRDGERERERERGGERERERRI